MNDPDPWCRGCGAEGVVRDTVPLGYRTPAQARTTHYTQTTTAA